MVKIALLEHEWTEWCFILCTLDNLSLTRHYGCAGQFALEMYFHCHVININGLYKIPMDGRHLVVAKGYSDDVYSKPSCLALISTMYYFAISQHRRIQIPARNWKWYHPPPTLHPNQTALRQSLPHMKLVYPSQPQGRGRAGAWRMQDFFALQEQAILRLGSSWRSLPQVPKAQCH